MTVRLSHSSLTGTVRTDVAVGHGQRGVHVLRGAGRARRGARCSVGSSLAAAGAGGLRVLGDRAGGAGWPARRRPRPGAAWRPGVGPAWSDFCSALLARRGLARPASASAGFGSACCSGFSARLLRLLAGFVGGLRLRLARGGLLRRPWRPAYRCSLPSRWSGSTSPTRARRCPGPSGTGRTSRRRATRWLRSRGTGIQTEGLGTAARLGSPLPVRARLESVQTSRLVPHATKCAAEGWHSGTV